MPSLALRSSSSLLYCLFPNCGPPPRAVDVDVGPHQQLWRSAQLSSPSSISIAPDDDDELHSPIHASQARIFFLASSFLRLCCNDSFRPGRATRRLTTTSTVYCVVPRGKNLTFASGSYLLYSLGLSTRTHASFGATGGTESGRMECTVREERTLAKTKLANCLSNHGVRTMYYSTRCKVLKIFCNVSR